MTDTPWIFGFFPMACVSSAKLGLRAFNNVNEMVL